MIYGPDITKRIVALLAENANVRYVCSKVGIDHSTFYKWKMHYPEFDRQVMYALHLGRSNLGDVAEAVVVNKMQDGDMNAAKFYLTHNNTRYMTKQKENQYRHLLQTEARTIDRAEESENITKFIEFFEPYIILEETIGPEEAKRRMEPIVRISFGEEAIVSLFFDSYEEWKKQQNTDVELREQLDGFLNE